MKAISKYHPLKHYTWGDDCDGWNFVDATALSVKQEKMPPGVLEIKHYDTLAQQFFFILKGNALFEIEDSTIEIKSGEAGKEHRVE